MEEIDWDGSAWATDLISSNTYQQIVADGGEPYTLYGLRPDGIVDQMQWNGSAWTTKAALVSGTYGSIAASFTHAGVLGGAQITPEPSTLALLVSGLMGLLAYASRKRK